MIYQDNNLGISTKIKNTVLKLYNKKIGRLIMKEFPYSINHKIDKKELINIYKQS